MTLAYWTSGADVNFPPPASNLQNCQRAHEIFFLDEMRCANAAVRTKVRIFRRGGSSQKKPAAKHFATNPKQLCKK
jgi:aminoglycoside phosphotransferase family enzyme